MTAWAIVLLAVATGSLLYYGAVVEPRRFETTRLDLTLPNWPVALDGYTIVHLSDLHTRRPSHVEEFVAALPERLDIPDLLVVTGDFAESHDGLDACLAALAPLQARHGRYAVLGNNDLSSRRHRDELLDGLTTIGFEVLVDRCVRIEADGAAFWLGGADFTHLRRGAATHVYSVPLAFDGATPGEPRILLAHSPDLVPEAAAEGVDLVLCGHTHGGQICLPGGRPLHNNLYRFRPPFYTSGRFEVGRTTLYVNRGLGMTRPLLRTWCPPEVAILRLYAPE